MYDFKFADIGEGIHEGKILKWNFKVGDKVKEGSIVLMLEVEGAAAASAPAPAPASTPAPAPAPGWHRATPDRHQSSLGQFQDLVLACYRTKAGRDGPSRFHL